MSRSVRPERSSGRSLRAGDVRGHAAVPGRAVHRRGRHGHRLRGAGRERNTRVALKTLRALDGEALLRFKSEFRALQDLQHPNLVALGELVSRRRRVVLHDGARRRRRPSSLEHVAGRATARSTSAAARGARASSRAGCVALHARRGPPRHQAVEHPGRPTTGAWCCSTSGSRPTSTRAQHEPTATSSAPSTYMAPEQAAGARSAPAADWYASASCSTRRSPAAAVHRRAAARC